MNASKKILLATAIIAAGYGAAALCGQPSTLCLATKSPAGAPALREFAAGTSSAAGKSVQAPSLPGSPRLIPDTSALSSPKTAAAEMPARTADHMDETALNVRATEAQVEPSDSIFAVSSPTHAMAEPIAKLRDEAPRPLGTRARSDAVTTSVAPGRTGKPMANGAYADGSGFGLSGANQRTEPVRDPLSKDLPLADLPGQLSATSSVTPQRATPLTPLPSLPSSEGKEPRSHIVVDGDSLAKLAGRYLDDPRRALEIYELNRDLLSDPDLLPIGVELTIPARSASESSGVASPQSSLPRSVAIHSSYRSGLVPVRPAPTASSLTPRARLAYPRTAD